MKTNSGRETDSNRTDSTAKGTFEQGTETNRIFLRDAHSGQWLNFSRPQQIVCTHKVEEVVDCLREIEFLVETRGWAAAGFVAYEAAPAFDAALRVREDTRFPLLWFGLYLPPQPVDLPEPVPSLPDLPWSPTVNWGEYADSIGRIHDYIGAGDTYQVNYTYRLRAPFRGDAWSLFTQMAAAHQPEFGGFLQTREWSILSLSPELFFQFDGEDIL